MKIKVSERTEAYLDKIILTKFTGCFMNDHKWVKLINKLTEHASIIKKCRVKLIWDETHSRELLLDESTSYMFDYYDKSMESMISGIPKGWYDYKEIEWIAFPRMVYSPKEIQQQDIDAIYKAIQQVGELGIEMDTYELKIYGYK